MIVDEAPNTTYDIYIHIASPFPSILLEIYRYYTDISCPKIQRIIYIWEYIKILVSCFILTQKKVSCLVNYYQHVMSHSDVVLIVFLGPVFLQKECTIELNKRLDPLVDNLRGTVAPCNILVLDAYNHGLVKVSHQITIENNERNRSLMAFGSILWCHW